MAMVEEGKSVANFAVGKKVLVRDRNDGINAGIVEMADETGVILKGARRLYFHKPKDNKLSWFEGVAESGLSEDSKVSGTVTQKIIIADNYSMTLCTDEAFLSIMNHKPNES